MVESDNAADVDEPPRTTAGPRRRADAQRNIERLVAAAREAFAEHGAEASLDDIARRAGVGSGTLYRHFPTRPSLMEAVYRAGVEQLCARGEQLRDVEPAGDALIEWLRAFVTYVAQKHGLAKALVPTIGKDASFFAECQGMINTTGGALLERAKAEGAVRSDVELLDLLWLAGSFAQAGENSQEGPALSERLLMIAIDGLRPSHAGSPE
jgi:AcrR family transcriptional regulator